jgi:hypothetical protein
MSGPSIERIEKAIAELGQEYRSPPGWEDRVRAATRRRRPIKWAAIGAIVAAAAASLLWWSVPGRPEAEPAPREPVRPPSSHAAFESSIVPSDDVMRGAARARLGDRLRGTVRGGKHRAMWLYHNDRLLLRCPGAPGCAASDRVLSLEVLLDLLGRYTLVGVSHDAPLPAPTGGFDEDLAAAKGAGATTHQDIVTVE